MAVGDNYIGQHGERRRERPGLEQHGDIHHVRRLRVLLRPRDASRRTRPTQPDGHHQPVGEPGSTDSTTAVQPYSMIAFVDHTFGLTPLTGGVANAYDYSNSFNFSQKPLVGPKMTYTHIPAAERARLARLLPTVEDDPT